MIRLHVLRVCAVGVAVGSLGIAGAQQGAGAQQDAMEQQAPLFRTQSNLVLVDVVVRSHGKAVEGLGQSEFRVLEDGKQQKITVFEEHKATDAVEVAKAPALPAGEVSNDPQYALTSAANVVLLDALNTPYADQVYVRRQMLQFLKTIPAGARVAVFTLSSRLRMVEGFGAGPDALEKALKEKQSNAEVSPVMDTRFDQAMTDLNNMAMSGDPSSYAVSSMQQFQGDQQQFQMGLRIQMTLNAMDELGRYLSTIPGRKNLIWFSGAFPPILRGSGRMGQVSEETDYDQLVDKTDALLTLARVSVYPVDARGLLDSSNYTAEQNEMNPRLFNSIQGVGGQPTLSQQIEQQNTAFRQVNQDEHLLMKQVAKQTGGEAFINTNELGQAVGEAIANGSSYYTIGYVPDNRSYNGSYRNIEVKLEESHYDLQYRRGYYGLDAAKERALIPGQVSPLIAAMQRGAPELSQVLFRARALPAEAAQLKTVAAAGDGGRMAAGLKNPQRYVVDYWVAPSTLQMETLADGRKQAKLELTQVVYDRLGVRQNYSDAGMELDLTPADAAKAMQDGIHLQQQIDLPEGQAFLRLGVVDLETGRIGTVEMALTAARER